MPKKEKGKLRIIPLGGLNEIGKNMTVLEYGEDMIIVDCGLGFPDEDMPGVDLVIPDISYLEANKEKIRGLVLTHGHEDHIGAIPYVLRQIDLPIYATKLTLGIIKNKLEEHELPFAPNLNCVQAGNTVRLGAFSVEFIHANHSIADACCLAITTPLGVVIHTGDFKLDVSPIDGDMMGMEFYLHFSLLMDRSPGFGSMATNFMRPIQTRSRYAFGTEYLKLARYYNSPDRSTKSTSSHINVL